MALSEDEARILLAYAGNGGGYTPTRMDDGWLFTPPFGHQPLAGEVPWFVGDDATVSALNPVLGGFASPEGTRLGPR